MSLAMSFFKIMRVIFNFNSESAKFNSFKYSTTTNFILFLKAKDWEKIDDRCTNMNLPNISLCSAEKYQNINFGTKQLHLTFSVWRFCHFHSKLFHSLLSLCNLSECLNGHLGLLQPTDSFHLIFDPQLFSRPYTAVTLVKAFFSEGSQLSSKIS